MTELTPTMKNAVEYAGQHGGCLVRYPGGFWMRQDANYIQDRSFSTPTVNALVKRGYGAYTEWKDGRNGRFPIRFALQEPA